MNSLGHKVTGSDDVIFEPSKSNLQKAGLLPESFVWFPEKINKNIDIVILGMHAKRDNVELKEALEMNLKIANFKTPVRLNHYPQL